MIPRRDPRRIGRFSTRAGYHPPPLPGPLRSGSMTNDNAPEPAPQPPTHGVPPLVKLAIEFGPLVVFFVTQRMTERLNGLYWATIAFMVAISVAVIASRVLEKRWPTVPLITAVFVLVMGGLTLYMDSEVFIMVKPTLVNLLFAGILLGGLLRGKLFLKSLFGPNLSMPDEAWRTFTLRFGLWFVFLGVLNEVLRRSLTIDDWTSFKTFGLPILSVVFMASQIPLLNRHMDQPDQPDGQQ